MTLQEEFALARERAKEGRDPTCADEVLALLLALARECKAARYLEIGAGEGYTAISVRWETGAEVTAIEQDAERCVRARENFARYGCPVRLLEGDAGEILPLLTGEFDVIFLDGPKAQYRRYLPDCKRLLKKGGYLVSDDVLLYGWVRGEPPKKRRMLVEHIREYLSLIQSDPDLETTVYEYGEGVAVSKKIL